MGMVIEGRWEELDNVINNGRYIRPSSVFNASLGSDVIEAIATEPGRFHLIASESCPWSHRAMLVRALKNLEAVIPMHIAHGPRVQGYSVNGGVPWKVPGSDKSIVHLHELYTLSATSYTGRSSVPILWDSKQQQIVSNESAEIMRAFDAVRLASDQLDFTLVPEHLLPEIDALNAEIYEGLSNGVYRAVFAETQDAYDAAITRVFETLDKLEVRLSKQRYLLGDTITEADWRLFPTLFRFDAVYYIQHLTAYRRLTDYLNLWAYARDLYAWNGVAETLNLDAMRTAAYVNSGNGIVPIAPDADWGLPHGRETLGPAHLAQRSSKTFDVDPINFQQRKLV